MSNPVKIHYISESIRCCGAGTAADTEFVTAAISSNIELHALSTGRKPHVVTAMTMLKQHLFRFVSYSYVVMVLSPNHDYRNQGNIGAALVLGGVDITGPQLFTIHPHGSTDKLPYVTMGSGSLAAMAVFESSWKPDLSVSLVLSVSLRYAELTSPPSTARRRPQASDGRHLCRYLQRSWVGFERRRMHRHCNGHRDAAQLCQTERAG